MREEFTRVRIRCAAHQELLFAFTAAHSRAVVRMPSGFSKTYSCGALGMWELGHDHTARGAILSASEGQAAKPVAMVRDYIDGEVETPELRMVFPTLRRTQREGDPWTQSKLVVDRPAGIRDPSLVAIGLGGRLPGARLSWILVDDVVDEENSRTEGGREMVRRWFSSVVLARRDVKGARIIVTNTPWHPKDLTYFLEERMRWPTLTMDIEGEVVITNTDWDSPLIRPAFLAKPRSVPKGVENVSVCRLSAHDDAVFGVPYCVSADDVVGEPIGYRVAKPEELDAAEPVDVEEQVPLWPECYPRKQIERLRDELPALEFMQLYKMRCRDEESSRCKQWWVDQCKALAYQLGFHMFVSRYRGSNLTVTGVDLGIGEGEADAQTSFFTFEVIPKIEVRIPATGEVVVRRNMRRVLEVDTGRWSGPEIISRLIDKAERFGSIVAVETNAGQRWIRQWALERDASILVRSHTTGKNKHSVAHGVESVFIELENGAWLLPSDGDGRCNPMLENAINHCLFYQPPPAHTEDDLMAWWIGRELVRKIHLGIGEDDDGRPGSTGAEIMAR